MKKTYHTPTKKLTDMKHQLFLNDFWNTNKELIKKDTRFINFCSVFDLAVNIENFKTFSCYFTVKLNKELTN